MRYARVENSFRSYQIIVSLQGGENLFGEEVFLPCTPPFQKLLYIQKTAAETNVSGYFFYFISSIWRSAFE